MKSASSLKLQEGPSWPWAYGSWIYNYLWNQCLSSLMLWVRISIRARCTTLCDKVCQWLATDRWFSSGPPVSSPNKTDRHDITEILLKVTFNTIKNKKIKLQTWTHIMGNNKALYFTPSDFQIENNNKLSPFRVWTRWSLLIKCTTIFLTKCDVFLFF